MMKEIVENYQPDGLLLDYLRFNNQPMRLDPHGEAELTKQVGAEAGAVPVRQLQRFKEACLTKLMREISVAVRQQQPGIKLAVYLGGRTSHATIASPRIGQPGLKSSTSIW